MYKSAVIYFLLIICAIVDAHHNYILICPNLRPNIFADPEDSRKYIQCINGEAFIYKCPPGTEFSPLINRCDPHHFHGHPLITQQRHIPIVFCPITFYGNIPHPTDCQKYLTCNHGIIIYTMTCLHGAVYNARTARCDSPINVPGCQDSFGNGINYRRDIFLSNGYIWIGDIEYERRGNFMILWNVFNNNYWQKPVNQVMVGYNQPYFHGTNCQSGNIPQGNFPSGNTPQGNFPSGNIPQGHYIHGNIPQNYLPSGNFAINDFSHHQMPNKNDNNNNNNYNNVPDDTLAINNVFDNNINHISHVEDDVSHQKPVINDFDKDEPDVTLKEHEDNKDDDIEYPDIDIR